eukprot:1472455-Pyramimonas_sp.AAC.2
MRNITTKNVSTVHAYYSLVQCRIMLNTLRCVSVGVDHSRVVTAVGGACRARGFDRNQLVT